MILLLLLSVGSGLLPSAAEDKEGGENLAEWTVMVYMASDNNLEGAGVEDMNEMESIGSSEKLNYIVQMDRAEGYDTSNGDWTGAKRYRVEKDDDTGTIGSTELEDMGEINMGDPQVLADFIIWAHENYPAKRYFLDLWDHGGAFWGICWDDSEGSGDPITMLELKEALDMAVKHMGRNFDLVGYDACLMAQMAVLYQIKDYTDLQVASGFVEPGDGWPYERIFKALDKKPEMSPEELGSEVVNDYMDSYTDNNGDPDDSYMLSMALFDMSKIVDLTQGINRYSMLLATKNMRHNFQVKTSRSFAGCYSFPPNPGPFKISGYVLFDLIDLIDKIETSVVADSELIAAGRNVKELASDMIVDVRAEYHKESNGLSIYFPNEIDAKYDPMYSDLDFAMESYWDEYLNLFPDPLTNVQNTPPSITIDVREGQEIGTLNGTFLITGTAFDLQESPSVEVMIDGGDWVDAMILEGGEDLVWHFDWDIAPLETGDHTISVMASDTGGGESGVITRDVLIINEPGVSGDRSSTNPWTVIVLVVIFLVLLAAGVYLFKKRK